MTSALDKHALLYNKEKREKQNIKKEQVEQENSNKI